MRAIMLHGVPDDVRIDQIDPPALTDCGVLVRLTAGALCPTDRKLVKRKGKRMRLPMPLGHELAGEVIAVGERASGFEIGDGVWVRGARPCGSCFYCTRDQSNYCEQWDMGSGLWGFVEMMHFSEPNLSDRVVRVPDALKAEETALVEPLSCVVASVERAEIVPGDDVAILGAGAMGLMHLLLARLVGAGRVFVVDKVPFRMQKALDLGATAVIDFAAVDAVQAIRDLTGGKGISAVFDTTSSLQAAAQAVRMARRRGTVVLFGGYPPPGRLDMDVNWIHYSGINLCGTEASTLAHAQRAIHLMAEGRLDVGPLITHRLPMEAIREAIELSASQGDALKMILLP